jgi:hypothetical protein
MFGIGSALKKVAKKAEKAVKEVIEKPIELVATLIHGNPDNINYEFDNSIDTVPNVDELEKLKEIDAQSAQNVTDILTQQQNLKALDASLKQTSAISQLLATMQDTQQKQVEISKQEAEIKNRNILYIAAIGIIGAFSAFFITKKRKQHGN